MLRRRVTAWAATSGGREAASVEHAVATGFQRTDVVTAIAPVGVAVVAALARDGVAQAVAAPGHSAVVVARGAIAGLVAFLMGGIAQAVAATARGSAVRLGCFA